MISYSGQFDLIFLIRRDYIVVEADSIIFGDTVAKMVEKKIDIIYWHESTRTCSINLHGETTPPHFFQLHLCIDECVQTDTNISKYSQFDRFQLRNICLFDGEQFSKGLEGVG